MMTLTFRMNRRRLLAYALTAAVVLSGGLYLRSMMMGEALSTEAQNGKLKKVSLTAKTEEDRAQFIKSFGWEVDSEPLEIREILIPREFDEVFDKYNFLQKQQGFDLARQKGKRCRRYTYNVTNYPGGIENVRLNMIVYKNKVVGGDVCTASLDGFMHGFDIATATTWLSIPENSGPVESTLSPVQGQDAELRDISPEQFPTE